MHSVFVCIVAFNLFLFLSDKWSAFMESKGASIPGMLVLTQNLSKVSIKWSVLYLLSEEVGVVAI